MSIFWFFKIFFTILIACLDDQKQLKKMISLKVCSSLGYLPNHILVLRIQCQPNLLCIKHVASHLCFYILYSIQLACSFSQRCLQLWTEIPADSPAGACNENSGSCTVTLLKSSLGGPIWLAQEG